MYSCWSWIGKRGGAQNLSLADKAGCYRNRAIIMEFMHAMGFYSEHVRLKVLQTSGYTCITFITHYFLHQLYIKLLKIFCILHVYSTNKLVVVENGLR